MCTFIIFAFTNHLRPSLPSPPPASLRSPTPSSFGSELPIASAATPPPASPWQPSADWPLRPRRRRRRRRGPTSAPLPLQGPYRANDESRHRRLLPTGPAPPPLRRRRCRSVVWLRRRRARQPPPAGVVRLRRPRASSGSAAVGPGNAAGPAPAATVASPAGVRPRPRPASSGSAAGQRLRRRLRQGPTSTPLPLQGPYCANDESRHRRLLPTGPAPPPLRLRRCRSVVRLRRRRASSGSVAGVPGTAAGPAPPPAGVLPRRRPASSGSAAGGLTNAAGDATVSAGGACDTTVTATSPGIVAICRRSVSGRLLARRRRRPVAGPLPARRRRRRAPTGLAGASTGGGSFKALPGVYRPPPSCVCFRSASTPVDKVTTFLHVRTAPTLLGKVFTPRIVHTPGRKLGAKSRAHGSISAAVAGLSHSYNNANLDYL